MLEKIGATPPKLVIAAVVGGAVNCIPVWLFLKYGDQDIAFGAAITLGAFFLSTIVAVWNM